MNHENSLTEIKKKNHTLHRQRCENSSVNELTPEQWENCKKYFDYACAYCGDKSHGLSKDHFISLNLGGGLTVDNVVPCCPRCNSSKSNRKFHLWFKNTPFYSHQRELKIYEYLKTHQDI